MATSLPALNIRPPENPLDQYAKALSVKSMIGGQQLQQQQLQLGSQEVQKGQIQIADMNARNAAMSKWDGKNPDDLANLIKEQGGSYDSYVAAKKQALDMRQSYSKIALDDSTTGKNQIETLQKQYDQIAGGLESLVDEKAVPDDQLHQEASRAVNGFMHDGLMDAAHGQELQSKIDATRDPKELRTLIDHYAKVHMSASELASQAKSQAETGHAIAEANLANQKVKLFTSSKPGDFDAQIDQLVPPTANNPNADLNQQAKVMVNGLLARGDYEGAAKALENTQHVLNQRAETNFVQGREDARAANARTANQSNQLQKNAIEQIDKIWSDPQHGYTQFLAQANATKQAIADAKDGNELAASLAPLMTVLGVNSFAGVHRINPQEYQAAGPGVGSIYRRINTALDKAVQGKLNPDTAKEMESLVEELKQSKHSSLIPATQMIAANSKDQNGKGIDPSAITVFDKDGAPNTLDNVLKGIKPAQAAPPPASNTAPALKVGQMVSVRGKQMKITAVHPDGSFDAQ